MKEISLNDEFNNSIGKKGLALSIYSQGRDLSKSIIMRAFCIHYGEEHTVFIDGEKKRKKANPYNLPMITKKTMLP